jgi:hypothetical protein
MNPLLNIVTSNVGASSVLLAVRITQERSEPDFIDETGELGSYVTSLPIRYQLMSTDNRTQLCNFGQFVLDMAR